MSANSCETCKYTDCAWDSEPCDECTKNNSNYSQAIKADAARPRGEWIEKQVIRADDKNVISEWQSARCSVCNKYHTTPYMYYFDAFNYCPNCGADMRGADDE